MELFEALHTRRSIRKYDKNKKVSDEQIKKILAAAMSAPTARNYQSWRFVVITGRELLDKIPGVHPYASMMKEAACGILVCGDMSVEAMAEYNNQNCSAATQNILLAAHALGLGAVWLGVYPREKRVEGLRALLSIPENILPISLVAIGHAAEEKGREDRYDVKKVHYNGW